MSASGGAGRELRFYLNDDADFNKFKQAVTSELSNTEFHGGTEEKGDEAEHAAEEAEQAADLNAKE